MNTQRYTALVNGVFLMLLSYCAAVTLNNYIEYYLLSTLQLASTSTDRKGNIALAIKTFDEYKIIGKQNLFLPKEERGKTKQAAQELLPVAQPAVVSVNLKLVGAIAASDNSSMVIIEEMGRQTQEIYSIGDTIPGGGVITAIGEDSMTYKVGNTAQTLRMDFK